MAFLSPNRWRRLKSRAWILPRIARGLRLFMPMTCDVLAGRYRPVPWKAFALMLGAAGYLLMPFDLVPDFILPFGLVDDALIVSWLLARIDEQLEAYRAWQARS
ncbi:hypothetical protein GCM10022228_05590 [Halomonas cibimaris]|uniref:DUF1232 domain-containing protein n=1 Tax=Halomonas cibimaris TaxID=657012 RepID=A0ABP7LBZ9_9GAMM